MENAIDKECFGLFAYGIEVGGLLADDGTGVGDTFHFFHHISVVLWGSFDRLLYYS